MKATAALAVSRIASSQTLGIVTLPGGSLIATRENKHGAIIATLSRKQFGAERNLKGQALKREYADYRRTFGVDTLNVGISAAMTSGRVVAQKITPTSKGFSVAFVRAAELEVKASDKAKATEKSAQAAADERLKAMLEEKAQTLAKQLNCSIEQARTYLK